MGQSTSIVLMIAAASAYMWLLNTTRRQHQELMARRERWNEWADGDEPDDDWTDAVILEGDESDRPSHSSGTTFN